MRQKPAWQTSADPADLVRGYRAARELQALPIPAALARQIANYICAAGAELASRGIDPEKPALQEPSAEVTWLPRRGTV